MWESLADANDLTVSLKSFLASLDQYPILVRGGEYEIRCDGKNHILRTLDGFGYVQGPCQCDIREPGGHGEK